MPLFCILKICWSLPGNLKYATGDPYVLYRLTKKVGLNFNPKSTTFARKRIRFACLLAFLGKERKEKGGIKKVIWRVGLEKELYRK